MKYIKVEDALKIADEGCGAFRGIFGRIRERLESTQPADVVPKERYANLLANSIIVCEALKKYQSADIVQVVRCKDCKYGKEFTDVNGYRFRVCNNPNFAHGLAAENHGFCKWGKRSEDGTN